MPGYQLQHTRIVSYYTSFVIFDKDYSYRSALYGQIKELAIASPFKNIVVGDEGLEPPTLSV